MGGNDLLNGTTNCPVGDRWHDFTDKFDAALKNCKELDAAMQLLLKNTGHLTLLPELSEGITALSLIMKEIKDNLIAPATGRDQIPTDTMNKILDYQNKQDRYKNYVLGFVIMSLIVTIGMLLVGERKGVINPLKDHYNNNPDVIPEHAPSSTRKEVSWRYV